MRIGEILKEEQPELYELFKHIGRGNKSFSFSDYKRMMKHSSYRRGKGGSIKQLK